MCGIAGIVDINGKKTDPELIIEMIKAIKHRGPDDEGTYFTYGNQETDTSGTVTLTGNCSSVSLGHKRLSIIDLSRSGRQPLSNEDNSIQLVCNGEIYNYKEIKSSILRTGHRFKSQSDSEVIIHLYEDYGEDCVKYLRGMFAFGLWDRNKSKLIIARDRLGIKPLYYYFQNGKFIFASEIKSILCDNSVRKEIDAFALSQYFSYLYIPAPKTIFNNIFKVMPGTIIRLQDGQLDKRPYWDLNILCHDSQNRNSWELNDEKTVDYYKDTIYQLLEESVKIRMSSDVPIGAFLSGGIDSSAIVGIMSKFSAKPVKTFSIGFGENGKHYDELEYSRIVSNKFSTDHTEFKVGPDIVNLLPTIVGHFDEPFANPTAVLMYMLSEETKKHVDVAISGTGGDETFSGYTRYAGMKFAEYAQVVPHTLRNAARLLANRIPESTNGRHVGRRLRNFISGTLMQPEARYKSWVSVFDHELKDELFSNSFSTDAYNRYECLCHKFDRTQRKTCFRNEEESYLGQYLFNDDISSIHDRVFYTDIKTYLPNNQLEYVDKMSMAHALEVRVPFCDHNLLEFAATIPHHLKIKGMSTKYLLKRAISELLPQEIINRKKVGFNVPIGSWFQGELSGFLHDTLSKSNLQKNDFFNYKSVKAIIDRHNTGERDFSLHIWALLVFQIWYETYFNE